MVNLLPIKKEFSVVSLALTKSSLLWGLQLLVATLYGNSEKIELARQGDIDAQLSVGFSLSVASPNKRQDALYWMKKAGNQGNITACQYLGNVYKNGIGTSINLTKAEEWYIKAIAYGGDQILLNLGRVYEQDGKILLALAAYKLSSDRGPDKASTESFERLKRMIPQVVAQNIPDTMNELKKRILRIPTFEYNHPKKSVSKSSTVTLQDGSTFRGKMRNHIPHGYGHWTNSNGTSYIGNFKYGLEDGMGTSFSSNGLVTFKGMWKQGKPVK